MKRVSLFMLTLALLFSTLAIAVSSQDSATALTKIDGYSTSKPYYMPLGVAAGAVSVPSATASPKDITKEISFGLTADLNDLSNIKNGVSAIGVTSNTSGFNSLTDGVWGTGYSVGVANDATSYYNVKGEKATAEQIGTDGFAYRWLFTFNFGSIHEMSHFGYVVNYGNGCIRVMPPAADIYVSDDGVNWTLVGYYDNPSQHLIGTDYNDLLAKYWGKDTTGATATSTLRGTYFVLPEGTSGQYLRLACTTVGGSGASLPNATNYAGCCQTVDKTVGIREILVFGHEKGVDLAGAQSGVSTDNGSYKVRFIANVDDYTKYDGLGFAVKASYAAGKYAANGKDYGDLNCAYVYDSLYGESGDETVTYTAGYFDGQTVAAYGIQNIPLDSGAVTFTVTPYYYLNGVRIEGASYQVVCNTNGDGAVDSISAIG